MTKVTGKWLKSVTFECFTNVCISIIKQIKGYKGYKSDTFLRVIFSLAHACYFTYIIDKQFNLVDD